jgi:DNA-binding SARP family transcriptional activator
VLKDGTQDISDAKDCDLIVFTLGTFEVYQKELLVENWNGRKGAAIFKYLLVNRQRHVHKDELMDVFWQDSDVNSARNNLNVAIHSARHALRTSANDFSHIVYDADGYSLNPDLRIWVDHEQFTHCCHQAQDCERKGDSTSAIQHYVEAEQLYCGELFPESLYEEWTIERREQLQTLYLITLDRLSNLYFHLGDFAACAALCHKTLAIQPTSEEAHCRLMRCYSRQGQRHLAQRQYAQCVRALEADQVSPNDETIALNAQIRAGHMA